MASSRFLADFGCSSFEDLIEQDLSSRGNPPPPNPAEDAAGASAEEFEDEEEEEEEQKATDQEVIVEEASSLLAFPAIWQFQLQCQPPAAHRARWPASTKAAYRA